MNYVLEVLEFIFQDFWHWLGTLLLFGVIFKPFIYVNRGNKNQKDSQS